MTVRTVDALVNTSASRDTTAELFTYSLHRTIPVDSILSGQTQKASHFSQRSGGRSLMRYERITGLISTTRPEAPRSLLLRGPVLISIPSRPLFPDTI